MAQVDVVTTDAPGNTQMPLAIAAMLVPQSLVAHSGITGMQEENPVHAHLLWLEEQKRTGTVATYVPAGPTGTQPQPTTALRRIIDHLRENARSGERQIGSQIRSQSAHSVFGGGVEAANDGLRDANNKLRMLLYKRTAGARDAETNANTLVQPSRKKRKVSADKYQYVRKCFTSHA